MLEKDILSIHDALVRGEVTSEELVREAIKRSHEVEESCNAFVTILDDQKGGDVTDNLLSGILSNQCFTFGTGWSSACE